MCVSLQSQNAEMMQQTSIGLVLEGGGMRGMFTCGVLDVLMEAGVKFGGAIGVSAGACFGVNVKSEQIGRAIRYQLAMAGNKRYMSVRSLLLTGNLVNAEYAYHIVPRDIDPFDIETFSRTPMEFIVVCTDVHTGQPVYHPLDPIDYDELEWIRASASLPLVAQPVHVDGLDLLDGGLSDSIPLKYMQERGYLRNLVVLTQPLGYRKPQASHLWAMRWSTRHYPEVLECLRRRPDVYNAQVDYAMAEAAEGHVLIIAPSEKLDIGRLEMNTEKILSVYHAGRRACREKLQEIWQFCQQ